jgi:DNA-binding beta-propeller fold protein YncE
MKRGARAIAMIGALAVGLLAQAGPDPTYTATATWASLPPGEAWGETSAVASDGKDRIVVLRRVEPSFLVFTTAGRFVKSWGEGLFQWAHGVRVDRDGFLWATDGADNLVYKLTIDGKRVLTLGRKGVTGDDRSREAFDRPTDVAVAPGGEVFVSDGYGNSRVVKFSRDGEFLGIIGGRKGAGPGEFDLPHALVIDSQSRLLVGDRENARIQVFDLDGAFLEAWSGLGKPYGLSIAGDDTLYVADAEAGTITIAKNGKALDVIRDLGRPHWIGIDPSGALYVADVQARQVQKIVKR